MVKIELCPKDSCTGCKACMNSCKKNAITFYEDSEGFVFPKIDTNLCVKCGSCVRNCPILNPPKGNQDSHPLTYVAYAKDKKVITTSSSGGIFTLLANFILENGGIVFGASQQEGSLYVSHIPITSKKDIHFLQGSKYVQSDINNTYQTALEFLKLGKLVLFSGTPCQIAGLYSFIHKDYENLITAEVVCHGVPSYKFFKIYIDKLDIKNISRFNFRNEKIWSYDTIVYKKNKRKILIGEKDFYMRAFLHGDIFRESCYNCRFAKLPRIADVTLGDFWGIQKYKHSISTSPNGNSVIIINNEKGEHLINCILNECVYEEMDLEYAMKRNHNIYEPSLRPKNRSTIYSDMETMTLKQLAHKYGYNFTLRNYMGFIKRRLKEFFLS